MVSDGIAVATLLTSRLATCSLDKVPEVRGERLGPQFGVRKILDDLFRILFGLCPLERLANPVQIAGKNVDDALPKGESLALARGGQEAPPRRQAGQEHGP